MSSPDLYGAGNRTEHTDEHPSIYHGLYNLGLAQLDTTGNLCTADYSRAIWTAPQSRLMVDILHGSQGWFRYIILFATDVTYEEERSFYIDALPTGSFLSMLLLLQPPPAQ